MTVKLESISAIVGLLTWLTCIHLFIVWITKPRKLPPKYPPLPPHEHPEKDIWTGHCYVCGKATTIENCKLLYSHGKPPQHYCEYCSPSLNNKTSKT